MSLPASENRSSHGGKRTVPAYRTPVDLPRRTTARGPRTPSLHGTHGSYTPITFWTYSIHTLIPSNFQDFPTPPARRRPGADAAAAQEQESAVPPSLLAGPAASPGGRPRLPTPLLLLLLLTLWIPQLSPG